MANINQPVFILRPDTDRYSGKNALRMNIMAAKILENIVRTTLGPKGMDKMLNDSLGDVTVTNDGATILREMEIAQPAARMLVEIAKKQEEIVGDGTTSVIVIAGELLAKAEELIEDGIAPSIIINGYLDASRKVLEYYEEIAIDSRDAETLKKVAMTAMTGKGSDYAKEHLANLVVESVMRVADDEFKVEQGSINVQRINGDSVADSFVSEGVVVDKSPILPSMPKDVTDAKIALVKYPIELHSLNTSAKIDLNDPSQMQAFLANEEEMVKDLVQKVIDSGCNVLFCQKGIDDMAENYLNKAGIMAYKRVSRTDMKRLHQATGAKIITDIEDLSEDKLGNAGHVYIKKIFDHKVTFVEDCVNPKATSIVLRGSTRYITEQLSRALDDALGVVSATYEEGKVLIGGGACEMAVIRKLREYSETIRGREQLSVLAFANALEVIPRTLAENAGLDTIDLIADLKAAQTSSTNMGLNILEGKIVDMSEEGVLEPLKVKTQAIKSAVEASQMILRIDDMIAASGALNSTGPDESGNDASGMPPMPPAGGMTGGMPPMM